MTTIGLVSLGCAKNLVDSEMILGMFEGGAYAFTDDPAKADVLIVNTCGFIDEAKKESIETILRLSAGSHAKLVVTGCFVERNLDELRKSLPEVALWIPLSAYATMNETLGRFLGTDDLKPLNPLRRVLDGNEAMAYLRISEGCDNYCSFCAIPFIRGRLVSRPLPEIAEEAHILLAKGIQEIDVVSQDPLHYGKDRPETGETPLKLLKTIDDMGFRAVRLLYLYPDEITDEELLFIKDSKTILPYFDIPIQSGSDRILRLMNRKSTRDSLTKLFGKIRSLIPNAVLRTTIISGFPGETEEDHKATLSLIDELRFDHLGVFPYSREEGTASYRFPHQLDAVIKNKRRDEIMALQRKISYEQNKKRIGETMEGFVTGHDAERGLYSLRSYWNAPDGIDGDIYFRSNRPHREGDWVQVRITSSFVYDLMGEEYF